jgi:hypothetical protein
MRERIEEIEGTRNYAEIMAGLKHEPVGPDQMIPVAEKLCDESSKELQRAILSRLCQQIPVGISLTLSEVEFGNSKKDMKMYHRDTSPGLHAYRVGPALNAGPLAEPYVHVECIRLFLIKVALFEGYPVEVDWE